jgi:fructokinase
VEIVSVGEVLWDVLGDREFLGGAPLNFSANARKLGHSVLLLTAVGADHRGSRALDQINELGINSELVQTVSERATGTAAVVIDSSGSPSFVIERPAAFDFVTADETVLSRLRDFDPDWFYFGTLVQTDPRNEALLHQLIRQSGRAKCFYDMNLRSGHWNFDLVQRLSNIASVLKLNDAEAELLFHRVFDNRPFNLEEFCGYWSSTHGIETICVTLGAEGCAAFMNRSLQKFPGYPVSVVDTVGAGDAFAAAFLHGLELGWPAKRIAGFANALGAVVASRAGATPEWTLEDCLKITAMTGESSQPNSAV